MNLTNYKNYYINTIKKISLMKFCLENENKVGLKEFNVLNFQNLLKTINFSQDMCVANFEKAEKRLSEEDFLELNNYVIYLCKLHKVNIYMDVEYNLKPPFKT